MRVGHVPRNSRRRVIIIVARVDAPRPRMDHSWPKSEPWHGLARLRSRRIALLARFRLVALGAAVFATIAIGSPRLADAAVSAFDAATMAAMTHMDAAMMHAPMTGDADRDFVAMMIPHHAGAVAMATIELQYGHDPRLRRLAQEIVVTQRSEITVMRDVRRDLPKVQ